MTSYYLKQPEKIKISLTNICNYRCVMCYNPRLRQSRGFIDSGLMGRILSDCRKSGIKQVALGATGEPLLHKDYLTFLHTATEYGLQVSTTSNCSTLSKEKTDRILELGLSKLNISIYSATPEQHRRYTGLNNFHEVVANIRYFLESWHKKQSSIKINMWFLQIPDINEYEDYINFWGPLANNVGISLPRKEPINWSGRVGLASAPGKLPKFWMERTSGRIVFCTRRKVRCEHVRSYLHILHNGDVLPCCNIPEPGNNNEILFGNIGSESIMDIWGSSRYRDFKKKHEEMQVGAYPLCKICSEIEKIGRMHFPPMFFG